MEKIDLKDVTFLIPLRLDSIERIENLQLVVDFLTRHFDTHIHIVEAAKFNNEILRKILPEEVEIKFMEDFDPVFHRTYYINIMVQGTFTPYCAIWDADVITDCAQLHESVQILRDGHSDFVYPYTDLFLDVPEIIKEHYREAMDMSILVNNMGKMEKLYHPVPVGGAFLVNRKKYIEAGLENENFYGWGIEDGERMNRWKILGYEIQRVPGALFHLTHSRSSNSQFHDSRQSEIKTHELYRIGLMSRKELEEEVKEWRSKETICNL